MFLYSFMRLTRQRVASLALACAAPLAMAQADPQSIVITGSRVPIPVGQATSDVLVIDDAALRNAQGRSVEEILQQVAGLQLSRNGAPGQSAGVFIRGSAANNTVVLIDGVRVGSATLGQFAFEGLSVAQIDRIEVLRGPGSSLYGADAVGGVIQIFTKRGSAQAPHWQAAAHRGGFGASALEASLRGGTGLLDYALSLGRESSDGVSAVAVPGGAFGAYNPDADGFGRTSGAAQLGWSVAAGHRIGLAATHSRLQAQFDSVDFPPPDFAADASGDYRNRLKARTVALNHTGQWSPHWRSELVWSDQREDLRSGLATPDRFTTERRQLSWQHTVQWAPQMSTVAVVERMRTEAQIEGAFASYAKQRTNTALGVATMAGWGGHRLQADLRRDRNSAYGSNTTGRLGYHVQFLPQLSMRAALGTAFRAPSFNETDFPDFGVVTIRPETARSAEVGARWQAGGAQVQATLYRNRVRDLIAYEPPNADPALSRCPAGYANGCAFNVGRALLKGVSLNGEGRNGPWQWRAAVDYLDARDAQSGQRLLLRARHTEHLSVGYDTGSWGAQVGVQGVGSRLSGGALLSAYELLELSAHWRFAPQWQLQTRLLNALDRRYEPVKDYGALGRQFWLGLRFDSAGG
jgi:vitamin B12 transporter